MGLHGSRPAQACGNTDIKWPNDLLASERKICGILAETVDTEQGRAVVVGIGINLTKEAFPATLAGLAISVEDATTRRPERDIILAAVIRGFEHWYAVLNETGGSQQILETWATHSSYAEGKSVSISNGDEVMRGVTRGVESDGALRVETGNGALTIIRAGDVTSVRPAA